MATPNVGSMSAVDIAHQLYTGPGSQEPYDAQYSWVAVREAMDEANDLLRQALGNAREGWEGEAADAAIARISPFGAWSDDAGVNAAKRSEERRVGKECLL